MTLAGEHEGRELSLPVGSLLVPARQRLARVAAQLLEAQSEDSLATWNFFDNRIADPAAEASESAAWPYPVVRLKSLPPDRKTEVLRR